MNIDLSNLTKKSEVHYQSADGYFLKQNDLLYKKKWFFIPFEKEFDEDRLLNAVETLKKLNDIEFKK